MPVVRGDAPRLYCRSFYSMPEEAAFFHLENTRHSYRNPLYLPPIPTHPTLSLSSSHPRPPLQANANMSTSDSSPLPSKEDVKDEVIAASKSAASSVRSLAAGAVGGLCAVIVGHPFDLVKVRMQTAEKGVYSGAVDCFRRGVAKDGLRRVSRIQLIGLLILMDWG